MTFYRVLSGTEPNPTLSLPSAWQGTAAGMSAQIAVWTGVNPSTPFDVADAIGNSAAAASWTAPAITTVSARAQVVSALATSDDNALALGTPQGFSARMSGADYDTTAGGDHSVGLADKAQASAGAAAMPTWSQTLNAPDTWAGITFALRPAPADIAPGASLTGLANGATFSAPASIILTASATDSDGSVIQVEFFDGASLVATVPIVAGSSPSVTLSNVAAGTHLYTVRATDNSGAQTTSAVVSVTVTANAMQTYFILPDHLNTPRMVQDQNANVVWKWDQAEPFGNDVPNNNPSGAGAFDFPLRFPGQYFDRETNLAYNYYRDYDPNLGRFVQSDPIGLRGGLNTYLYTAADPLGSSDPEGLAGGKFIYTKCSDNQIIRCVEECRAKGERYQDCSNVYVQIPGVNGGKPKFKDSYCVCEPKSAPTPFCGPNCIKTIAFVGAIVIMICTKIPMPVP